MIRKIICNFKCIAVGLLLCCSALNAQEFGHEFLLYGGGGLSTMQYDAVAGKQKAGFGGHFGLGYNLFLSKNWSLGTGVEFAFYSTRYNLDSYHTRYMTVDIEDNEFEFRSTISDYEEKQRAAMFQIPLMFQFQTGKKHMLYAAAGLKVGIPISGKYKSSNAGIQNSGYYAREDYEYTTQTFMGFGLFTGKNASGDLNFKTAFIASAELGVKWRLNEKWALYTGAYLDYGLNNIAKTQQAKSHLIEYNTVSPRNFAVNSIFNSQHTTSGSTQPFVDKINPIAAGIRLKLAFGKNSIQKKDNVLPEQLETGNTNNAGTMFPNANAINEDAERKAAAEKADAERLAKVQEEQRLADAARKEAIERAAAEKAKQEEEEFQRKAEAIQALQEELQPVGNFLLSHTQLNAVQKQQLDRDIALLQKYPDTKIFIYGHTCNSGSAEVNERVALQRAENAKNYLLSKGFAESRILGIASKRDTEPLVPNINEHNRKINRRVEIVFQY